MLFNFWFDADAAPQSASARLKLYKPGTGDYAFPATMAPHAGATAAVAADLTERGLTLFPVEPNPFGGSTRVSFATGHERPARLVVVDVSGRVVKTLLDGTVPSGRTWLGWDGRDDSGREAASGIYFFRLSTREGARTTKGILLR
jgi:hypothetical protein